MKKYIIILLLTVFSFINMNADTKNNYITNYSEVIGNIKYPTVCRQEGIEGKVVVRIIIKENKIIDYKFTEYPCSDLKTAVEDVLNDLNFNINSDKNTVLILPVHFKLK